MLRRSACVTGAIGNAVTGAAGGETNTTARECSTGSTRVPAPGARIVIPSTSPRAGSSGADRRARALSILAC